MEDYLGYPVKYAILELKERKGWADNYKYETVGFIVSKCYVLDSNIKYYRDGSQRLSYEVEFPYRNNPDYEISLKHIYEVPNPTRDISGYCNTADTVFMLFESYEEALLYADEKNQKLKNDICLKLYVFERNWDEKYEKLKNKFDEKQLECKKIEEWILNHTTLMKVTKRQIGFNNNLEEQSRNVLTKKLIPEKPEHN